MLVSRLNCSVWISLFSSGRNCHFPMRPAAVTPPTPLRPRLIVLPVCSTPVSPSTLIKFSRGVTVILSPYLFCRYWALSTKSFCLRRVSIILKLARSLASLIFFISCLVILLSWACRPAGAIRNPADRRRMTVMYLIVFISSRIKSVKSSTKYVPFQASGTIYRKCLKMISFQVKNLSIFIVKIIDIR